MSDSGGDAKESVTEVAAEASFTRERPLEIERGSVLAGRYQVEEIIGKGGSGIVLRVFDRTAQNLVALKLLKDELARDAKWEKRFSRELRLGRPIQHPNVCRIFDIGEADGHRFLTMELARGGSLRDELKRSKSLDRPMEDKLTDARAAIAGLAALHAAGVVHRDFKPDNLLRMEDGRLVLADFGLATDAANAPGATVLIGTPHYMAPEVLNGDPATSRSDVWALGVVLHEIFFGQRPERRSVSFDGSAKGPLRPQSHVERRMLALCEMCLAESPFDRPADARVVAQALESARPPRPQEVRRNRVRSIGVVFAVLALGIGGVLAVRRGRNDTSLSGAKVGGLLPFDPTGEPADWNEQARVVAELPGRVHCFSIVGPHTARVVWGAPRSAEDVDLATGKRSPAPWRPDVYRSSCPETSADGKRLLYTARNKAGATEILMSTSTDGGSATAVTYGADPLWLRSSDELVYDADASHVALFSVPTMTSTFLPELTLGGHLAIGAKAVNHTGTALVELLYNERAEPIAAVMSGRPFEEVAAFRVPVGSVVQFADEGDDLLISLPTVSGAGDLVSMDWRRGRSVRLARYGDFQLQFFRRTSTGEAAVANKSSRDVWLEEGAGRRRLTYDGQNYTAAMSPAGVLLVSKRSGSGAFAIWRQAAEGPAERLTEGPDDVEPAVSADSKHWAYVDYKRMSIMLCEAESKECRVLRRDGLLPSWPMFSQDGALIAYLTQLNSPQLTVISTQDGSVVGSWNAHFQCPPIWSSVTTVWSLESSPGGYAWSEREVTGKRTGRQFTATSENLEPGEVQCFPKALAVDRPLVRPVTIETVETSRVIVRRGSP
jgi:hypothetical protein